MYCIRLLAESEEKLKNIVEAFRWHYEYQKQGKKQTLSINFMKFMESIETKKARNIANELIDSHSKEEKNCYGSRTLSLICKHIGMLN